MITRIICGIELDVDPFAANAIYFDEEFAKRLESDEIEVIQKAIYHSCGVYHPISVLWELTNQCNYRCPFCYIHYPGAKPYSFIDRSKWLPLIESLVEEGMLFCTLSGGECLLHPDFPEIYTALKERGVIVTVFTNASLLSPIHFDLFRKYPPYKVEASLYSKFGNSCCTGRDAENAMRNILQLKDLGVQIVCKTPINRATEPEYKQLMEWSKENNILYYSSVELLATYEGNGLENLRASEDLIASEEQVKCQNKAASTKKEWGIKRKFDCSGGTFGAFVSYDLGLYPCISAYGINEYRYDLSANSVHDCISKLRTRIEMERKESVEGCSGCQYYDVCDRCALSPYFRGGEIGQRCEDLAKCIDQFL